MPTYLSPGVYVEEVESGSRPIEGVGTAVAAFVGFAAQGPFNTPTLVSNWSQFTATFGDFVDEAYLAHAVYGYFSNGGGNCYIVRVGEGSSNGKAGASGSQQPALAPQATLGRYLIQAKPAAIGDGGRRSAHASSGGEDLTVEIGPPENVENPSDDVFTLVVKRGDKVEEHFPNVTTRRGKDNVVNVVRERSQTITIEEVAGATTAKPQAGAVVLSAPPPVPAHVGANDYVGDAAERTGFGGLEAVDEITMVGVPDLMSAYQRGAIDLETVKAVQLAMITHCELMGDRMAIIDPPPGLNAQQVREWRNEYAGYDSKYAALYYPWIKVFDPATGTNKMVPPAGHMAGVWARNDAIRGVHKAPANEVVRGAVALENQITRTEQELLNPIGVNCIRAFPGRGIRIWGARTLSSDPAWRYLNVRRLFNYVEKSILGGTQWVVFEPNDDALWAKIRRTIGAFLVNEWRKGALFGLTPDEAYYVRCDRETNPAEQIDAGQVVCEIGIAPVKPAEFVIFRLAQLSGGTSSVSE
jgi:uncharacterized protein